MSADSRIPYPGLRAFKRDESDLFFGREGCVDDMVDRLAETRFLAVLGASGSGKSSLVRTGLLDALELGFHARAGSDWLVAEMHPGADPMAALATALLRAKGAPFEPLDEELLAEDLRRGPRSVSQWCQAGHLPAGYNLLILADQFEELFRYGDYAQREAAEAFVDLLLESAATPDAAISVVLTMRSEFLAACTLFEGLAERINRGLYLTPRMSRQNCALAIEGPAQVCGFTVEPALVNRLLNDMTAFAPWEDRSSADQIERLSRRADQLPLMQHVLNLLWLRELDRHGPVVLTEAAYEAIGGLKGALDEHGAAIMASLGPVAEPAVEAVFRALVLGSSVATAVRRPTTVGEIVALSKLDFEEVRQVLDAYRAPGSSFVQPPLATILAAGTIIDLSHESLIRQWSALSAWTLKEARSIDYWTRLNAAADRYTHREGDLLYGLDLAMFAAWWDAEQPSPFWQARHGGDFDQTTAYLAQSRSVQDAAEQKRLAAEQKEKNGLRRRAAAWATLSVVATTGAGFAIVNAQQAQHASALAHEQSLKATSQSVIANTQRTIADKALKVVVSQNKALIDARAERDAAQKRSFEARILEAREEIQNKEQAKFMAVSEEVHKEKMGALVKIFVPASEQAKVNEAIKDGVNGKDFIDRLTQHNKQNVKEYGLSLDQAGTSVVSGKQELTANVATPFSQPSRDGSAQSQESETSSGPSPQNLTQDIEKALANRQTPDAAGLRSDLVENERAKAQATTGLQHAQVVFETASVRASRSPMSSPAQADLARAAYDLALIRSMLGQTDEAKPAAETLDRLARQTENVAVARAAGIMQADARSDLAHSAGDDRIGKKWDDDFDARAKQLDSAQNPSPDELLLLTIAALDWAGDGAINSSERNAAVDKACQLANRLAAAKPGDTLALRQSVRCLWAQADNQVDKDAKILNLDKAERAVRDLLAERPKDQTLKLTLVQALVSRMNALDDGDAKLKLRLEAADALVDSVADQPLTTRNRGAFQSAYDTVTNYEFNSSVERLKFFAPIARALGPAGEAFPKSEFGYMLADARRNVAENLSQDAEAEAYFNAAVEGFNRNGSLAKLARHYQDAPLPDFSEVPATVCGTEGKLLHLKTRGNDVETSKMLLDDMVASCEPALNAYPFDFYLRVPLIAARLNFGEMLYRTHRPQEARSYLEYASKWGESDATNTLADMYAEGEGLPADAKIASQMRDKAAHQGMKRFTVPAQFDGKPIPVEVYIRDWPDEYYKGLGLTGIHDQVQWLKQARGGDIPKDVIASFDKLQDIAIQNNVSFTELAVYALNAAQDADTGATPEDAKAIFDQIHAARFHRNPWVNSDGSGVALRGFDAVSYAQGAQPKAGRASVFALWAGAVWLFADETNRAEFLKSPARYVPQYGGFCAYCMATHHLIQPSPTSFLVSDGHTYLFNSNDSRTLWSNETAKLKAQADRNWLRSSGSIDADRNTALGNMIAKVGKVPGIRKAAFDKMKMLRETALINSIEQDSDKEGLAETLGGRSYEYVLLGRADDALRDADQALGIEPNLSWILINKGDALLEKGQVKDAIQLFEQVADEPNLNNQTLRQDVCSDMLEMTEAGAAPRSETEKVELALKCKAPAK